MWLGPQYARPPLVTAFKSLLSHSLSFENRERAMRSKFRFDLAEHGRAQQERPLDSKSKIASKRRKGMPILCKIALNGNFLL